MKRSEAIDELASALAKAIGEYPPIPKKTENPFFKSMYADLSDVKKLIDPVLSKNGLSVTQDPEWINGQDVLTSTLMHSSGQFKSSTMRLILGKVDMQGLGAATTYGKRQAYCAIIGCVGEPDDDGNAASNANQASEPEPVVAKDLRDAMKRQVNGLDDDAKTRLRAEWKKQTIPGIDFLSRYHYGLADKLVQSEVIRAHAANEDSVRSAFNVNPDSVPPTESDESSLEDTSEAINSDSATSSPESADDALERAIAAVDLMNGKLVDTSLVHRDLSVAGNLATRKARLTQALAAEDRADSLATQNLDPS